MGNNGMKVLVILALLVLAGPGCNRKPRSAEQWVPPTRSITPTWGQAGQGLQCRIRPVKTLWEPGQTLQFKLDLRNSGQRVFAVSEPIRGKRIAIDGRWYPWPQAVDSPMKVRALGPGAEMADLPLELSPSTHLPLGPGRHHVQVMLEFEGIEVSSGPVGIEIATTS